MFFEDWINSTAAMIKLFHAGYEEIKTPDVFYGRKNADFGQGFYTTDDSSFASFWVREKKGAEVYVNSYELDETGLLVKEFERTPEWFRYVFSNRRSMPDGYVDYDLIIGPVANDTIFDTLGIMTSGYLKDEEAMRLLCVGPCYRQITLKTKRAAAALRFVGSKILDKKTIDEGKILHQRQQEQYFAEFTRVMEELS